MLILLLLLLFYSSSTLKKYSNSYLKMLYQKQKTNPRSPLTVIRNQIRNTLQTTSSRSISRSPSYSPVSRNLKHASKDYSSYIPVRSLSKIENTKPTSSTTTHNDLKTKRKFLANESKKLEEKVREIKKNVEREVRNVRNSNNRKIPRSHCSLLCQRLKKVIVTYLKEQLKFSIEKIKIKAMAFQNIEDKAYEVYSKKLKKKIMERLIDTFKPLIIARRNQDEIAKRHYKWQLLLTTLSKWQEYLSLGRLKPEDKSCIEEMDSLLQSFMHDSNNISPPRSNSITPQKSNFFDSGINFREPSPNIFKLNIPEKLNFDSSELFSFRNSELSELDIIACQHYQHSLLVLFI